MNRHEWRTGRDPQAMLEAVGSTTTDRQYRLFACACARRVWGLVHLTARRVVEAVEAGVDHDLWPPPWNDARSVACEAVRRAGLSHRAAAASAAAIATSDVSARWAATSAASRAADCGDVRHWWHAMDEQAAQAAIMREVMGDPWRPKPVSPDWRTPTAVGLADAIDAEQAFDRMPILADALEEAGCDDPVVLDHCRGPHAHIKGCWVVDAVLGKG